MFSKTDSHKEYVPLDQICLSWDKTDFKFIRILLVRVVFFFSLDIFLLNVCVPIWLCYENLPV